MLFEPPIAAGGMASVHLGRMTGPAGFARTVAIKRLHPAYATDPEFVSMFIDEARLAARIRHPNVVPTIDVVSLEGELFLVMEYVHGESLSALMRLSREGETRPPLRVVASILCNALDGLHAAHEARSEKGEPLGLVHRDVSPHNILVGTDGIARVIDLGVAKAASRIATTRDGQLKGKLGYMAPEQIRGTVSRASDIYSGGIVLWEAVTMKRAFQATNEGELLEQVMAAVVDAPSKHVPEVPSAIDAIVGKALARNPAGRYTTARAMARAIEAEVPMAPPAEVGEWVEHLAHARLAERSATIAAIEGETEEATSAPSVAVVSSPTARAVTSPTASTLAEGKARPRGRVSVATLGLGVVAAGALVTAVLAVRGGRAPDAATAVAPPVSAPVASAAPSASATTIASAAPDVPTAAAPSVSSVDTAAAPSPAHKVVRRAPRPNCDPPYTFDDNGIKHYKRECSP